MSVAEQLAGYITTEKHSTTEMLTLVSEFREQGLGVGHLRTFIVDLAVRGKLTRGHRSDQTAQTLFDAIQSERITFYKNWGIRPPRKKSLRPQLPFSIPEDWRSVSLEELSLNVHYGYTASANAMLRDVRMLRITDIQNGKVNWETVPGCEIEADKIDQYRLHDNDLLIARTGGTIGKTFLISDVRLTSVFASYLIRVVPSTLISARFLKLFFETSFYWRQLEDKSAGTGQPNVNATSLKSLVLPLPPLAEQQRIVSKVDRLMGICDRLESERRETLSLTDRSRRSVLASLTSSRDASELASSWRRLSDHFEILHDRPKTLADLRQTILALAVQGKLVKQDPNDEPASDEKLDDLLRESSLNGYSKKPSDAPEGTPILRISAGTSRDDFYVEETDHKWIELNDSEIEKFRLQTNDLLACRFNGNLHFVGRFSLYRGSLSIEQIFPDKLIRFRVDLNRLVPRFAALALNSQSSRKKIEAFCNTTAGNIGISSSNLKTIVFRVPPLAEQHRIVAKVDRLLAQCDRVAEQLRQRQATTEQLLTATIQRILADDVGNRERTAVS